MDKLINKILEVIGDYRVEDVGFAYQGITYSSIKTWIEQFEEDDREFILEELLHILPSSYLSKDNAVRILTDEFETLAKDFQFNSVQGFLDCTKFLDLQPDGKSQKILLEFVDNILKDRYGYSIDKCGNKEIKYWFYLDDVLASGKTFREDIVEEIKRYGEKEFRDSGIVIITSLMILHTWGRKNTEYAIGKAIGYPLANRLRFYRVATIDNNPIIHSYYNSKPMFNHVYPKQSEQGQKFLEFIENAFERDYEMSNEKYAFRNPEYPKEEKFYSSVANRDRYESIILKKGIEIINNINELRAQSTRPLGFCSPGYKTLGTGSHFFTWRNISNTCPLVFWYSGGNWTPLFEVQNRGH